MRSTSLCLVSRLWSQPWELKCGVCYVAHGLGFVLVGQVFKIHGTTTSMWTGCGRAGAIHEVSLNRLDCVLLDQGGWDESIDQSKRRIAGASPSSLQLSLESWKQHCCLLTTRAHLVTSFHQSLSSLSHPVLLSCAASRTRLPRDSRWAKIPRSHHPQVHSMSSQGKPIQQNGYQRVCSFNTQPVNHLSAFPLIL